MGDGRHATNTWLPLDGVVFGKRSLQAVDLAGHICGSEINLQLLHYDSVKGLARGGRDCCPITVLQLRAGSFTPMLPNGTSESARRVCYTALVHGS